MSAITPDAPIMQTAQQDQQIELPAFSDNVAFTETAYKLNLSQLHKDKIFLDGKAFYRGEGVKKDIRKARELFKEAMDLGHSEARRYLTQMVADWKTEKKLGFKKDSLEKVSVTNKLLFYRTSAKYGNDDSLCVLGQMFWRVNPESALKYFNKAIDAGNEDAPGYLKFFFRYLKHEADTDSDGNQKLKARYHYCIAKMYEGAQAGDEEDFEYKLNEYKYLEKAASEGHLLAIRRLQLIPNPLENKKQSPQMEEITAISDEEVVMLPPAVF